MEITTVGNGVGWVVLSGPRHEELLHITGILWSGNQDAPRLREFEGANPASLMSEDLPLLCTRREHYVVAEKTHGVRQWLVFGVIDGEPMAWLCNRRCALVMVSVSICASAFQGTLLDVELVQRRDDGRWECMVFDAVSCGGDYVGNAPYLDRLRWAETVVGTAQSPCFSIRVKPVRPASEVAHAFESLATHPHPTDGLVFTPMEEPVRKGLHPIMFKVKPAQMHTVDLIVMADADADADDVLSLCAVDGTLHIKCGCTSSSALHAIGESVGVGTIVECARHGGVWVPVGVRDDKDTPNSLHVVERTERNIDEDIWKETLCAALAPPAPPAEAAEAEATSWVAAPTAVGTRGLLYTIFDGDRVVANGRVGSGDTVRLWAEPPIARTAEEERTWRVLSEPAAVGRMGLTYTIFDGDRVIVDGRVDPMDSVCLMGHGE